MEGDTILRFMDKTPARADVRLTSRKQCDEWRRRIPKIRRAYVAQDWCNADTAPETHKQLSCNQLITPIATHFRLSAESPRHL